MPPNFTVIAHRGASASAPENTVAAIEAAAKKGADMVELDVQMTGDRHLVIFHDRDLERTTNGKGRLARTPYSRLRELDAGTWFHPKFAGERIPLLEEALAAVPPALAINLELKKTRRRAALLERLFGILKDADRLSRGSSSRVDRRPLLSASDAFLLEPCATQGLPTALITKSEPASALEEAARSGCRAWHPCHTHLSPEVIGAAHRLGLKVNTWTVDESERLEELVGWGVDGIFTNAPEVLRGIVSRRG